MKTQTNQETQTKQLEALSYQDWKDEKYSKGANSDTETQLQNKYLTYMRSFA